MTESTKFLVLKLYMSNLSKLIPDLINVAKTASEAILKIYHQDTHLDIQTKSDRTPLTEADLTSHTILCEGLQKLTPDYPILSEESPDISFAKRQMWQRYWLIDPLDGTQSFINRTGEFCISVALIENHRAILGILLAPISNRCIYGILNEGAFEIKGEQTLPIKTRSFNQDNCIMALTRSNSTQQAHFLNNNKPKAVIYCNSAIKFMHIATGEADIYPRFGNTSEWDTAAGQCIIEAAGGAVLDWEGKVLEYNRKDSLLNPPFIAMGDASVIASVVR